MVEHSLTLILIQQHRSLVSRGRSQIETAILVVRMANECTSWAVILLWELLLRTLREKHESAFTGETLCCPQIFEVYLFDYLFNWRRVLNGRVSWVPVVLHFNHLAMVQELVEESAGGALLVCCLKLDQVSLVSLGLKPWIFQFLYTIEIIIVFILFLFCMLILTLVSAMGFELKGMLALHHY